MWTNAVATEAGRLFRLFWTRRAGSRPDGNFSDYLGLRRAFLKVIVTTFENFKRKSAQNIHMF